jgi:hypothetical protein
LIPGGQVMEEADMDVVILQLCGHQWPDGGDH